MSSPKLLQSKCWYEYLEFSKQVEKQIAGSKNIYHARAKLWVRKLTTEYLGGGA